MPDSHHAPALTPDRARLDAALHGLGSVFRGMTARPEEDNCVCHWGSAEELALLKVPDVPLDPDLLRRTWRAVDWDDHAAVLRRVLPQFARSLVDGRGARDVDPAEAGRSFARGRWREWPRRQAAAVDAFLRAWWTWVLGDPAPAVPAHDVLVVCAEASGTLAPWLGIWNGRTGHPADRHLARAVGQWEYDLLRDELPWHTGEGEEREEAWRTELTGWLVGVAPERLRNAGASGQLVHRVRLMGIAGDARYEDPHW
ncbi:hypothetical protein ABT160_33120 [Streptomyces sp. NPDC001941]|uniref:hypothetical protein n=1 Tax=Streptomyces sp. NPDC001941 TaxID=3154659 RepID=UPI00331EFFFF